MNARIPIDEFDRHAMLVPLAARADVYYGCVALMTRKGPAATRIQGTSVSSGARSALLKAKMELLERVAQWEWSARGGNRVAGFRWHDGLRVEWRELERPRRADATGFCAGTDRRKALEHGLLEVLERDAVTRVFDGDGKVSQYEKPLRPTETELLRAQRAGATVFVHRNEYRLPTAIVLAHSTSGPGGAIGTACRPNLAAAVSKAVLESVMMLTTARRLARVRRTLPQFQGVLWASDNIARLRAELMEKSVPTGDVWTAPLSLDAVAARAEASYAEFPFDAVSAPESNVWRVQISGARSYVHATREPWPIG